MTDHAVGGIRDQLTALRERVQTLTAENGRLRRELTGADAGWERAGAERDELLALVQRVDALAVKLTDAGVLDDLKGVHPDEANAVWDGARALLATLDQKDR